MVRFSVAMKSFWKCTHFGCVCFPAVAYLMVPKVTKNSHVLGGGGGDMVNDLMYV